MGYCRPFIKWVRSLLTTWLYNPSDNLLQTTLFCRVLWEGHKRTQPRSSAIWSRTRYHWNCHCSSKSRRMPVCTKKVQGGTISSKFASWGNEKIIKNCIPVSSTTLDKTCFYILLFQVTYFSCQLILFSYITVVLFTVWIIVYHVTHLVETVPFTYVYYLKMISSPYCALSRVCSWLLFCFM